VLDYLESAIIGSVVQAIISIVVCLINYDVFVFADEIDDQNTKAAVNNLAFYLLSDGASEHEWGGAQLGHMKT
jgi:hypothetical protein